MVNQPHSVNFSHVIALHDWFAYVSFSMSIKTCLQTHTVDWEIFMLKSFVQKVAAVFTFHGQVNLRFLLFVVNIICTLKCHVSCQI